MPEPPFEEPSGLTFLIAAYEESAQVEHELTEGWSKGLESGKIAINSGKYALRTSRNLLQALSNLKL